MLPQVGTKDYLARLIQHLQTNLPDIDLDRNVFLGILLCLIAGQRNLIVDVDIEDDVDDVDDDDESHDAGTKGKAKERERRIQSRLERVCNMCETICSRVFDIDAKASGVSSRWTTGTLPTALFPVLNALQGSEVVSDTRPSAAFIDPQGRSRSSPSTPNSHYHRGHHHHHHTDDIIESSTTKPILPPPNKPLKGPYNESHRVHAQLTDEDVDDGTISSGTSHATTRSAVSEIEEDDEPGLKIPQVLILRGLEDARPGVHLKLLEILEERQVKWETQGIQTDQGDLDGVSADHNQETLMRSQPLPDGFMLIYVRPTLISRRMRYQKRMRRLAKKGGRKRPSSSVDLRLGGGEAELGDVPGWLIDKFALSCLAARHTLLHANTSSGREDAKRGGEALIDSKLLRTLRRLSEKAHMHPPLRFHISDLISTTIHHPELHSIFGSTSISDIKTFIRISRILFRSFSWRPELLNLDIKGREYDQRKKLQEAMEREEWYATEQDVRRLWRNLIRHRIEWRPVRERMLYTTVGSAGSYQTTSKPPTATRLRKEEERVDDIVDEVLVVLG